MVPPTEPSRFAAGEHGKSDKNLEEIGAKFLGPNCFRVVFLVGGTPTYIFVIFGNLEILEANLEALKTALNLIKLIM